MPRRLLRTIPVIALMVSAVLVGTPTAVSANPACDPNTNPTADLSVSQTASASPDASGSFTSVTYTIALPNAGPCSVSSFSFTDTLPSGYSSAAVVSETPSSISCTPSSMTPPTTSFSCSYGGNVGVPGQASVTLVVNWASTPNDTTNYVALSSSNTPPDPDLTNNTSYGAFVYNASKLNANLTAGKKGYLPQPGQQGQQIAAATPGHSISANMLFTDLTGHSCTKSCFGQLVRVSAPDVTSGNPALFVFVYSASLVPSGATLSDLKIFSSSDGLLGACPKKGAGSTACLLSAEKITDAILGVIYRLTVQTPHNDDWWGGI